MATLYVCTTCKREGADPEAERDGAKLLAALAHETVPEGVTITPVECLSACTNGCAVALSDAGKWTYVYGRMDPEIHAAEILEGAAKYAASTDGIVPWRDRPVIFRKQSIARIPPILTAQE
jgi:predicted metal-binding protein